ncbi:hypothetical protein V2J09_013042 [Rumex salicifolius]
MEDESNSSKLPTNKQLEEVGKCSSVGSVAQKKAYFESQYKNIAARKPEQEDKDKKKVIKIRDAVKLEDQTQRESLGDSNAAEPGLKNLDKSNDQYCVIAVELGSKLQKSGCEFSCSEAVESKDIVDEIEEQKSRCEISSSDTVENSEFADEMKKSIYSLPITELAIDESCFRPGTPELCKSEVEESPQNKAGTRASDIKHEREKVKSEKSLKSQRATSEKRVVSTSGVKKTRSSAMLTPKLSRPALLKSITPTPKALSKKENSKSPLTSKKPTSVDNRRVAPTSLHMSLNLDPSEGDMNGTMRKSLIMERMGDKDIVKRAFQAFRSNFNQLSSSDSSKPAAESEIPGKTTITKTASVGTPQKKNEGRIRLLKKSSPLSGQTGLGKTSIATRVPNTLGADMRLNKSHDMARQRNKVSTMVEDKVNGKAAERTQLQPKEKKEAEIKRLKNSSAPKTKAISATFASKSSSIQIRE